MGKHDDKITRAAHIKNHTMGTSNEISFSVLDAARNTLDGDKRTVEGGHRLGSISLFTLFSKKSISTPRKESDIVLPSESSSSAPSASTSVAKHQSAGQSRDNKSKRASRSTQGSSISLSADGNSDYKVKARKRARIRRKIAASLLISTALLAGVLAAAAHFQQIYLLDKNLNERISIQVEKLAAVDETLVPLDEQLAPLLVDNPRPAWDGDEVEHMNALRRQLPAQEESLNEIMSDSQSIADEANEGKNAETAGHVYIAASSRKEMIAAADMLMKEAASCSQSGGKANEAWQKILEGDALARESAQMVAAGSMESAQSSLDKANEAIAAFNEARDIIDEAVALYASADYSLYSQYVEKRIEAMNYAVVSNQALIDRNKEDAQSANDSYTAADSDAAGIAKRLPASPYQPALDAYADAEGNYRAVYISARSKASDADAYLRDYLGSSNK